MAELTDDPGELRRARASVHERRVDDGSVVLEIAGELDLSSVPLLRDSIDRAISFSPRTLVLDLREVDFMDSSGIAVLLTAAEQVGSVELHNPSEIIRRVITLSGLADVLRMTP